METQRVTPPPNLIGKECLHHVTLIKSPFIQISYGLQACTDGGVKVFKQNRVKKIQFNFLKYWIVFC